MTGYIEGIRLMCVEVEVIKIITTGVIPKISEEERSKLMIDLEEINEFREQESEKALDISKSLYDHFNEGETPSENESDAESVDPPESDVSIEDIEDDSAARSASDRSF